MIKHIIMKGREFFCTCVNSFLFRYFGVQCDYKKSHIEGIITIRAEKKNSIYLGNEIQIRSGKAYNIIGGDTRTILRTIGNGKIILGQFVGISNSALVSATEIRIEDHVLIGSGCKIWDLDFHSTKYEQRIQPMNRDYMSKPILIKKGAFVGGGSLILKGVTIGEKSIVAAGSVVSRDIPDGEIWGGNPVRFIKKIDD